MTQASEVIPLLKSLEINEFHHTKATSCITTCTCLASCSSPNTLRGPRVEIKASRRPQSCASSMAQSHICSSRCPDPNEFLHLFRMHFIILSYFIQKTRIFGMGKRVFMMAFKNFVSLFLWAFFGHCMALHDIAPIQKMCFEQDKWSNWAMLSLPVRATMPPCPSNVCQLRTCWCWTPSAKTWSWCSHVDSSNALTALAQHMGGAGSSHCCLLCFSNLQFFRNLQLIIVENMSIKHHQTICK